MRLFCIILLVLSTALPAAGIPIAKTGQTTCYNSSGAVVTCAGTGQDGELQIGVAWPAPRFRDNGNDTLTDTLTSLTWPKDAGTFGPAICLPGIAKTWQQALDFVQCLNNQQYLGSSDWHLPNIIELSTLLNYDGSISNWLASNGYRNVSSSGYWSSTTYGLDRLLAWTVSLESGSKTPNDKLTALNVLPVRAQADLIVTSVSSPTTATANTGQQVSVTVTVKNQGTANAVSSQMNLSTVVYLSTDSTVSPLTDVGLGQALIPTYSAPIRPGEERTVTITGTLPATMTTGDYYVIAVTDPIQYNWVEESDDNNNTTVAAGLIHVTKEYPDLLVQSLTPPASANAGQTISIPVTIKNQGAGIAVSTHTNIVTVVYLSTDNIVSPMDDVGLGQMLHNTNIAPMGPQEGRSGTITGTIPANMATGDYYVIAVTDPYQYNWVDEGPTPGENNNTTVAVSRIHITGQ